jgi:hypothetical protein
MKSLIPVFVLLFPVIAQAQTPRFDAGFAMGVQSYESSEESQRVLTSVDVLARGESLGVHVAVEYADLSDEGALIVTHPDVVYRKAFGTSGWFGLLGAGPTFATVGGLGHRSTWNAEGELEFAHGRTEFFGRVRQYDYSVKRFRQREIGPAGPAIYAGVRFRV